MKTLLIATAALTLMGGAAFAQDQSSAPAAPAAAPATTQDSMTAGSQMNTGTPPASDSSASATSSTAAPATSAPAADASSTSAGAMASNAPTGAAPESYPVCTSKHEDRCVNRHQATRSARAATRGQKTDNVQPSGM